MELYPQKYVKRIKGLVINFSLTSKTMNNINEMNLSPGIRYWIRKSIIPLMCIAVLWFFYLHFIEVQELFGEKVCMAISIAILLIIAINLLDVYFTSWIISPQQIIIKRGILIQKKDFIELYRIYDYSEKRNLIDLIFQLHNLTIYSSDKTNPKFIMYGLEENNNILNKLREWVENEKRNKGVREIGNL